MKFNVTINTYGDFNWEALVRAINPDVRLTKAGKLNGWFTREQLDRLEEAEVPYRVNY